MVCCFFWIKEIFTIANKVDRYFARKRNPDSDEQTAPSSPKNYLKLYRSLVAILVSLAISAISFGYITELYQWLVIITVCFFWVRELFFVADKIHDDLKYTKKLHEAVRMGTPIPERDGSVNTFHSIATAILCTAITVIHLAVFDGLLRLLVLVTVSFFWIREIFKIAHKVDRHFEIKRKERIDAINGATVKILEESTKND